MTTNVNTGKCRQITKCHWCKKYFEDGESVVTHPIFNRLTKFGLDILFCNTKCMDDFFKANSVAMLPINKHPIGTEIPCDQH